MRVFHKDGKINFVDTNNVFVGFDYYQSCCEHYGWFLSDEFPDQIDDVGDISEDRFNEDFQYYVFDTSVCVECGYMATFKMTYGGIVKYLTIFNDHNGYYSHGFNMSSDGGNIHYGCL